MATNKDTSGALKFDAVTIGSSGLNRSGGFISEEFLKELRGPRGMRTYREMADNDDTVGAILFAITMLIRQAKWTVQAIDQSPDGEAGKEFLESVLDDMTTPIEDVVDEVCSMFTYGHAPMEITWKRRGGRKAPDGSSRSEFDDGKIGVRSIALRAQPTVSRWDIDEDDDTIDGLFQQPYTGPEVYIPIIKLLLFRTTTVRNNPEGRSILRNAYRSWYFKKKLEEAEGIGVERDLAGLPMAMIPGEYFSADADPDQKATLRAWQKMVTNIRRDAQEGILMPSDRDSSGNPLFDFKLLSTGGARSFDTTKIVDRKNRGIATSVLADFIFLGQTAVGSFALSSDKTALFSTAIGGFLDAIANVFNRHFIPRLWELNDFDPATKPKMVPGDVEHANLAELAQLLTALTGAGQPLFPDPALENFIREQAGWPPAPEEGEDMRTPPGGTDTGGVDTSGDGAASGGV